MKKEKMHHVKSFFAMLLACLLIIESVPMEQVLAAEQKTIPIEQEAALSEEEAVFTGTLADGVSQEALSAMEDGRYIMPWEEEKVLEDENRISQEDEKKLSDENKISQEDEKKLSEEKKESLGDGQNVSDEGQNLSEAEQKNLQDEQKVSQDEQKVSEEATNVSAEQSQKSSTEQSANALSENSAETLTEQSAEQTAKKAPKSRALDSEIVPEKSEPTDLTEHVKLTQREFFINGKKVEDGSQFDVAAGANFSYQFAWLLDEHKDEGHPRPVIMDGDYFEVTLFTVKGLLLNDLKDQAAVINSNGRNVRIGTWSLTYHNGSSKDEENTGACVFRLEFSKYAGAFKEIGGYKKGSGKFDNKGLEDGTVSVGDAEGTITIVPTPEQPELPSNPPLPAGVNWNMPKPPEFNNQTYDFGKGIKWADHSGNATPAMEYRGVFVNELQEYQKQLLDVNKDIVADGVINEEEEKKISADFLQTSEHNYIIEDTLDVNQEFNAGTLPALNNKYVNQAPFFFEIPILAVGTGNFMNGNVGNAEYMLGSDFGNDYIDASKFTQVTKTTDNANKKSVAVEDPEAYVKATPMTWTIVKVKGEDGQRREKLIINIGKFHTNDNKEGLAQSDIKNKNFLNTIKNQITEANKNIVALQNTSSSPVQQLKEQTDKLENICKKAGVSEENIEKVKQEIELFNQWFNRHFPDDASKMKDMTVEAATEFAKLNLCTQMESLEADSTLLKDNDYANWKKYYKSLAVNQKFYETNREQYLKNWKDALMRYQMTKASYETGRIHGFVMKYATRVKNTSTNKFQNNIQISTGGKSYNADVELQITFAHGIVGTFAGGSAVFQKADSGYETLANAGKNGLAGATFHVFCADFDRETNDWILHQTQEHLGCFAGKDASLNGNAYVWSHNKANESDEAIEGIVAPEEAIVNVKTDEDGKLALEGLKDSEAHYLVETKAPEGYYLDTTPIRFQTEEGRVIYQMIPNVARAVRLTKESSYDHEAVEGAEFALFDKASNTQLTGFTKKSIKAPNGKVTQFYWYDQKGKDKLETFANGELNIHGLPAGTYYLQESRAGAGFVLPSNPPKYEFTLAEEITKESKAELYKDGEFYYALANPSADGKQPQAVLNDEMTKNVTITKIGKGGAVITGAAFQLLQWTGTEDEWKKNPSDDAKWKKVELNQAGSVYFKTNAKKLEAVEAGGEAKEGYEVDDHGQLTFTNIPKGHYALLETQAPEGYELALNRWHFDVDITNENPVQVSWNPNGVSPVAENKIPNEFKNGTLKLQKLVSGTGGDLNEEFRFEIALKDRNQQNYEGWINYSFSTPKEDGSDSDSVESQRLYLDKDSEGKLKVPLKSGQILTVTGLSGGTAYTVKEVTPDEYNLVMQNAEGTIANEATVTVTARNRYKSGMLRLSKNVSGLNAEKDRAFHFELMLGDMWGNLLDNKEFTYTLIDSTGKNPTETGKIQVKKGIANLSLKSGQYMTIEGLPDGTFYEITEEKVDDYQTKISISNHKVDENGDSVEDASDTTTIEGNTAGQLIEDGYRDDVVFNNLCVPDECSLMIVKAVDCLQVNKEQEFQFTMTLKDVDGEAITGRYKAIRGVGEETEGTNEEIYFNHEGKASFSLKHQEFLLFTNLPEYATYKLEEDTPEGYDVSKGDKTEGVIREMTEDGKPVPITVVVTNHHREGNLKISKLVSGRGADLQKKFKFKLTLQKDGKALSGIFPYVKTNTVQSDAGENDKPDSIWGAILEKLATFKQKIEQSVRSDKVKESESMQLEVDKNGQAEVELKHGEEIVISGLPEGVEYAVYELEENNPDSAYNVEKTDATGTIQNDSISDARFINKFKVGQLNVKKTVAKGDKNKAFPFKVELSDKTINGLYNEMEFKNGVAEFTLKDGQVKLASQLPAGIKYTVTESGNDGYNVEKTGDTGIISETQHQIAEFTNTFKVGQLTVKKTVAKGDTDKAFSFQVELSDKSINGKYGDMEFANGVAKFTLKHGEEKSAEELPEGINYTVTEDKPSNYRVDSKDNTGTIEEGHHKVAEFTNTQEEGSLKISKLVEGNGGDRNQNFIFTISLKDADNKALQGNYAYTLTQQEGEETKVVEEGTLKFDESGKEETSLSHGQVVTIHNLPAGTTYKVEEQPDSAYEVTMEGGEGTIEKDKTATVLAKNRYKWGMLRLSKNVSGINADKDQAFNFQIMFGNEYGELLSDREFTYTLIDQTGKNPTETGKLKVKDGIANLSLKSGQYMTIEGIPDGTFYEITEEKVEDYQTKISISDNKIEKNVENTSGTSTIEGNTAGQLIEDGYRDDVVFNNISVPDECSLMITKSVNCMQVNKEQAFQFHLILKDKNGDAISGAYNATRLDGETEGKEEVISFNENGEASFTLKHQESLAFTNLPEHASYEVKEDKQDGYDISMGDAATGEIQEKVDENGKPIPITVVVTNHHREGNLKISKLVTGRGADLQKKFKFKLNLKNAKGEALSGQFPYVKTHALWNAEDENEQESKWDVFREKLEKFLKLQKDTDSEKSAENKKDADSKNVVESKKDTKKDAKKNARAEQLEQVENVQQLHVVNGQAEIELKDGEEILISALPEGTQYEVEEISEYSDESENPYDVTSTGETGDIKNQFTSDARFINTFKVGALTVKKTVAKGDTTQEFPFKVELTNGTNINGKYGDMEFTNGVAEFTLKHGEEKKATELPMGIEYTVTETNHEGYVVESTENQKDKILNGETQVVEFTNTQEEGSLKISKQVEGKGADLQKKFEFTLSLENANGEALSGAFPYTKTDITKSEGEQEESKNQHLDVEHGQVIIELKHGEEMTVSELPKGTKYKVIETTDSAYTVKVTGTDGTVAKDAVAEGTIEKDVVAEADFVNAFKVGALTVKKTVAKGDTDKAFAFQVELSDKSINGTYGEIEFTNGVAKFTLKDGEEKTATDLPSGIIYTVTESDNDDYHVKKQGDTGLISDGKTQVAEFTNTRKVGALTVKKTVAKGDINKAFAFQVELSDKSINGTYGEMEFANGVAKFTLKHGEQKHATDLPTGIKYEVTESDNENYIAASEGAEGEISDGKTQVAEFTNTRKVGALTVKKTVAKGDTNKAFAFQVELSDKSINGKYGDMEFANGVAKFTLKHGGQKHATELPTGIEYTVTESDNEDYHVKKQGDTGLISDGKTQVAEFTNTRKVGALTVKKTVAKGDTNKAFAFQVELSDKNINGKYGEMEFANGVAKFTLKHGEQKHATELPTGIEYTVTESDNEDYIAASEGAEGEISDGNTQVAEFMNTRKVGALTVKKTVAKGDTNKAFAFQVELSDKSINGTYGEMEFANGVAKFTLKHGEQKHATELPTGIEYSVTESDNEDYIAASEGAEGEISDGNTQVAEFTNTRKVGALTVKKTVAKGDTTKAFAFQVELSDKSINGKYGEMEFVNGVAKFTLKHGEEKSAIELPTGIKYEVTESDNEDYIVASIGEKGEISETENRVAEFTNTQEEGSLKLRKIVEGNGGDRNQNFIFTISLKDANDKALQGSYAYTLTQQEGEETKVVEEGKFTPDTSGKIETHLSHGQVVTIHNLPVKTTYQVEEQPDNAYELTMEGGNGKIKKDETAEVLAQNRYKLGMLRLSKSVSGPNADMNKPFDFHLKFTDADGNVLADQTFPYTKISTGEDCWITSDYIILNEKGEATVSLKDGEHLTMQGLPAGTKYTITEDASDKYVTKVSMDYHKVNEDGEDVGDSSEPTMIEGNTANGSIEDHYRDNVLFNNIRVADEGTLMIVKTVDSLQVNKAQEFQFTITLKDKDGTLVNGDYHYKQGIEGELDAIEKNCSFKNGEYCFTLKHQEYVVFTDLPEGATYQIKEENPAGYDVSIGNAATGTIQKIENGKKPIPVVVTNYYREGNLKISKLVDGKGADLQKKFKFKLSLKNAKEEALNGQFPYTKTNVIQSAEDDVEQESKWDVLLEKLEKFLKIKKDVKEDVKKDVKKDADSEKSTKDKKNADSEKPEQSEKQQLDVKNGQAIIELKHGEEILIGALPEGTKYEVEEISEYSNESDNPYKVTVTGETGDIQNGIYSVVDFVNTFKVGALTVKKTVAKGDTTKAFPFQVKLDDTSINGTYGDMEFKDGVAEFTLKHGEEKKATDLPAGIKYEVTESDNKGYNVSSTGEKGTISEGKIQVADFTNTQKVGALTVKKTVAKGDTTKAFPFKVELKDTNISINGTYGDMKFKDGVAEFTLKDGEEKKATDLPAGIKYEVTETKHEGYSVSSTGETGTISDNKTQVAEFTNTQEEGSLQISKVVEGNGGDRNQKFVFTISLKDAHDKALQGSYAYELMKQEGEETKLVEEGKFTPDASGKIETHLSHGQILTIYNLPVKTTYQVEEQLDNAYEVTMEGEDSKESKEKYVKGSIKKDETAEVRARNRYRSGMLHLKKNVILSETEEADNATFYFTLHFQDKNNQALTGTYAYTGSAGEGTITLENGSAVVELKDGQEMTFQGLPAGSSYTITERKEEGYTTTVSTNTVSTKTVSTNTKETGNTITEDGNVASGSIQDNFRNDVVFYNVRIQKTGSLMISKFVESSYVDDEQEFVFHITLKDKTGKAVSGTFPTETGEIQFNADGKADFRLKHKESLIIKGIPEHTQYKVEEETPVGYDVSMGNGNTAEGEIQETVEGQAPINVIVTNYRREGDLYISKLVEGQGADLQEKFEFTIHLKNAKGEALKGAYAYEGFSELEGVSAPEHSVLKLDKNGQANVVLQHGQSIKIGGLPEGTTYQVTEKQNSAYETKSIDEEGAILNQTKAEARFVNRFRTGELHVRKTVSEGDKKQPFHFTVRLQNADTDTNADTDANIDTNININGIYGDLTFENGVAEFELKHGEEVIATGLPAGVKYVVEESSYENYVVTKTGDTGTIEDQKVSLAEFVNTEKEEIPPTPPEDPEEPENPEDPTPNPPADSEEPTPEPPTPPVLPENPRPIPPAKPESPVASETQPTISKEQKETTDKTETDSTVKTGDRTKLWVLFFLMGVSLCIIMALRKKRKKES